MNPQCVSGADFIMAAVRSTIEQGCLQRMREKSALFDKLKWYSSNQLKFYNIMGPQSVEGGEWTNIGESYPTGVQWDYDMVEESAFYLGRHFFIDKRLENLKDAVIEDPAQAQIKYYTEGMQRQLLDGIINGMPTDNNAKAFTGLRHRLTLLPTEQTIQAVDSSNALDLRVTASDYAQNVETFLILINKLIKAVDGGPDVLLVNEDFNIKFDSILRTSGLLTTTKDAFDREITTFKGIPIIDMGRKTDDTSYIITNNETITGGDGTPGSDACTSIYAVKMDPAHMIMLEKTPFTVSDNYNDPQGLKHNYVMDWGVGMMISHPRSVARLQGIQLF